MCGIDPPQGIAFQDRMAGDEPAIFEDPQLGGVVRHLETGLQECWRS
jgi:hypothetical protein